MAKKPKPKPERRTWDGLSEDDVTGADEAEDAMPMEFGRKRKPRLNDGQNQPDKTAGK
jgi:hypothetical protein